MLMSLSEAGNGGVSNSVWSSDQLKASSETTPRPSIDWNSIRENKDKYEELKWQGEWGLVYCRH